MDSLERLLAIEAIKTLKARYFRALDTKDWDLLAQVFVADAQCDFRDADIDPATGQSAVPGATDVVLVGRDAIVSSLREGLANVTSIHSGYMPEIDVLDAQHATGVWAMSDQLIFPAGPLAELRGSGHYCESDACGEGQWRISRLRLNRISVRSELRG